MRQIHFLVLLLGIASRLAYAETDAELCDTRAHEALAVGSGSYMPAMDLIIPQEEFDEMNDTVEHGPRLEPIISIKFNGQLYRDVEIHPRGNLSIYNPKKSYLLKFSKKERPTVAFYDDVTLPKLKRLVLNASWDDSSYLRNKLIFDLATRAGAIAPVVGFVNLCLNGRYYGFYQTIEKVDKEFMERRGVDDHVVYKADEPRTWSPAGDPYQSDVYPWGNQGFVDDTSDDDDPEELKMERKQELKDFLVQVNQDYTRIHYLDYLNFHQVNTFLGNGDTYDKNYYLLHDTEADAWRLIFWDGDLSMGLKLKGQLTPVRAEPAIIHGQWQAGNPQLFVKKWYKRYKQDYLKVYEQRLNPGEVFDVGKTVRKMENYRNYISKHAKRDLNKWLPARTLQARDFYGELPEWYGDVDFEKQCQHIADFLLSRPNIYRKLIQEQKGVVNEF